MNPGAGRGVQQKRSDLGGVYACVCGGGGEGDANDDDDDDFLWGFLLVGAAAFYVFVSGWRYMLFGEGGLLFLFLVMMMMMGVWVNLPACLLTEVVVVAGWLASLGLCPRQAAACVAGAAGGLPLPPPPLTQPTGFRASARSRFTGGERSPPPQPAIANSCPGGPGLGVHTSPLVVAVVLVSVMIRGAVRCGDCRRRGGGHPHCRLGQWLWVGGRVGGWAGGCSKQVHQALGVTRFFHDQGFRGFRVQRRWPPLGSKFSVEACLVRDTDQITMQPAEFNAIQPLHTSVPAGVYLFPNPRQRFALRIWPGTIQVSRSR